MGQFQTKIAEVQSLHGFDMVVILVRNPFTLNVYKKWFDAGWHRKKIADFTNMVSVMQYMTQIIAGQVVV